MIESRALSTVRVLWPYGLLWLLVAVALAATVVVQVAADRERDLALARVFADDLARLLADKLTQTLDGIDRTLGVVRNARERNLPSVPEALFEPSKLGEDVEHRFAVFDRSGRLVTATGSAAERALWDASGAIDFVDASMYPGSQLRVQRPVRLGATVFVPIVKRLDDADGEFDGVVASAIDARRIVASELAADDRVVRGLALTSGEIVARSAASAIAQDASEREAAMLSAIRRGDSKTQWRAIDGRPSLVAVRAVGSTGLAVFAGIDEATVFASNRFFAANGIGFLVLILAAVTLPLAFVARRALHDWSRRQRRGSESPDDRSRTRSDPLTGIANDAAFDEHLKNCHLLLGRYGKPFVLAFIDVDDFGKIKDERGRDAGDDALRRLARTMHDSVRETDLVARLEADTFAILMPGARVTTVKRVLEQLRATLGVDAVIGGWPITFSVGVVAFESAPPRPVDAMNLADSLMHDVKASGGNGIHYSIYRDHELLTASQVAPSRAADPV